MDNNIAIEFQHVGKQYRLGRVGTGTLSHDLNRWWQTSVLGKEDPYLKIGETNDRTTKGHSDYVWALKDITFNVKKGDVIGIIGKNGAGKSTLLKLLSHITSPSTGSIDYRGRIASLLEVGTGFHPELTARENIYMNGCIMGMTKHEINRKLDEIVEFAGIERYLDTPVKRFSSGMTVRLGFAIAAFLEPEILVVDEVLAVGDAEFQKKALGKMQEVSQGEGRTVLFVSHNMAAVRRLCNRGIVLNNGQMFFDGTTSDAVDHYLQIGIEKYAATSVAELPRMSKCTGRIQYLDVEFLDKENNPILPRSGGFLRVRFKINVKETYEGCGFSMAIYDAQGSQMMTFPTYALMDDFHLEQGIQYVSCDIPRLPLTLGCYKIGVWAGVKRESADHIDSLIPLDVQDDDFFRKGRNVSSVTTGRVVLCDYNWNVR